MCVCVCVCVFIKLHITTQSGPVIYSFYATRIDPPEGCVVCVCVCDVLVFLVPSFLYLVSVHTVYSKCVCTCVCVCVCVCVFIKLHITAQSGLVILVILCHSH